MNAGTRSHWNQNCLFNVQLGEALEREEDKFNA
jgi:hypothetical protein